MEPQDTHSLIIRTYKVHSEENVLGAFFKLMGLFFVISKMDTREPIHHIMNMGSHTYQHQQIIISIYGKRKENYLNKDINHI